MGDSENPSNLPSEDMNGDAEDTPIESGAELNGDGAGAMAMNGHHDFDMDAAAGDMAAWEMGLYTMSGQGSCRYCSGFYGPNFGEPVCATCHTFIYRRVDEEYEPNDAVCKPEDDDSGNEEPDPEALTSPVRTHWEENLALRRRGPEIGASQASFVNVVPQRRRRADSLAEQIALLTSPRPEPLPNTGRPKLPAVLPTEIWEKVFSYLDDFSLWSVGQVCRLWRKMLYLESPEANGKWRRFVETRWPITPILRRVTERATRGTHFWWELYGAMARSCPCKTCLYHTILSKSDDSSEDDRDSPPHLAPGDSGAWRAKRLRMEMKILAYEGTEGIEASPVNGDKSVWMGSLVGPRGSPYENGNFFLLIKLTKEYPLKPPVVRFLTKIFHPNVSRHGDIGLDSIQHNWTVALSISTLLLSIQSVLTDPFTHVCMEPAIGRLYREENELFNVIAKKWTEKYAMHHFKNVIPPLPPPSSSQQDPGPSKV
jgi:ubiquitin-conjugating enzyme E2 D/E